MAIFNLDAEHPFGTVQSVDTANIVISVFDSAMLSKLQVNHLIVIRSPKVGQSLIGLVTKIMRKYGDMQDVAEGEEVSSSDIVKVTLIGTLIDCYGIRNNVFKRTLESVPEIDADCYLMKEQMLTSFMSVISQEGAEAQYPLCIGSYAISDEAKAWIDGNKLFQRHAVITGSTGSGKSYTVAVLVEQIAALPSANAIIFDVHGEYSTLMHPNIKHLRVAGPTDGVGDNVLFLPYWLLSYEELLTLVLDRSDSNAPNQAMLFNKNVIKGKQDLLHSIGQHSLAEKITVDSPIPFSIKELITTLQALDVEEVAGARANTTKHGDYYGKLTRFVQRLNTKIMDKRLNFMFSSDDNLLKYEYLDMLCEILLLPASCGGGVKVIDFSEVPSDILPLIVSLVARLVFTVQQWTDRDQIHPVALFCDEAHLYLPQNVQKSSDQASVDNFERIAKEGRKYGVSLVVVTQRPSEVSRTVLSQSGNFIAMRLTNAEDQSIIKKLLPDSLGNFVDLLPVLDIGEALVVGDASLLPSRIIVSEPKSKPRSNTVQFWTQWSKDSVPVTLLDAVEAMRRQAKA